MGTLQETLYRFVAARLSRRKFMCNIFSRKLFTKSFPGRWVVFWNNRAVLTWLTWFTGLTRVVRDKISTAWGFISDSGSI